MTQLSQNVSQLSPELRYQIVNSVAAGNNDGPTLKELSVVGLAEGSLVYVVSSNDTYRYRPKSTAVVDASYNNVVKASGPGNWVKVVQIARVTLVGGTVNIVNHFDLSGGSGDYVVTGLSNSGGTGTRIGFTVSSSTATIQSSSNTDTSIVLVQYFERQIG